MAKFCIKCGSPLEEGQICSCQKNNVVDQKFQEQTIREQTIQEQILQEQILQEQILQEQTLQEETLQEQTLQEQTLQEETLQEQTLEERTHQEQSRQEQIRQEQTHQEQSRQEQTRQEQTIGEQTRQEQLLQDQTYQSYQKEQFTQNHSRNLNVQSAQPQHFRQDISGYQQQFKKARQISTKFIKQVYAVFKRILLAPATEGARFAVSADTVTAFGLFGFQAILSTLFALTVISKMDRIISLLYSSSLVSSDIIKMPYFRIIIATLIISFVLSCVLAGILLGMTLLFKITTSYKNMLCVAATRSVPLIPVTIVAIVFFCMNSSVGILLFFLGNLAGLCYMIAAFTTESKDKNKVPVIIFITAVIFVFISLYVMYESIAFYLPSELKDTWVYIKNAISNPYILYNK